jgi:serine/threonine protein kinase
MIGTARGTPSVDAALSEFADVTPLHAGERSTVYRAFEVATGRMVALKVLERSDPPPLVREAFDRECAALSRLGSHPHIVTLYRRITLDNHRTALVVELCDGSLTSRPKPRPGRRAGRAVAVGIKIAGALESAHRAGVLHRDIRPDNILITTLGEPAVSDFGTAALRYGTADVAAPMQFATAHTAPELLEGAPGTAATDVYGLASTMYELITGAPAFAGYADEPQAAALLRILRAPTPPIINPAVPLELSDVLLWAMAKDPAQRPPTAGWFADELARVAAHNGWRRTPLLVRGPASPLPS